MSIPRSEIPLALTAEAETATGVRYAWGPDRPPAERFKNLSFNTAISEGFSDGGVQFARRADLDFQDVKLLNKITFSGADGSVAYQGRISAIPRDVGADSHSVGVSLAGLIANASDRKVNEVYVDRDLSAWGPMSRQRRANVLAAALTPVDSSSSADATTGAAGISTEVNGAWVSPYYPISEAWYDAGSQCLVRFVEFVWTRDATTGSAAPWTWNVAVSSDDVQTATNDSGNLAAVGPNQQRFTSPTARRYARLAFFLSNTPAGADGVTYGVQWTKIAVHGNHGLQDYGYEPGEPSGYRSADVIRDVITRFCPQLHVGNIAAADYVIQHLAFRDTAATPYEIMQQVNKYHLFNLAVWEDGRVDWLPFNLADYDWQVRMGEDASVSLQGPSTDSFYNGIVVRYDDVITGRREALTPDSHPELQDTDPNNPWNQRAIERWAEIDLTYPHTTSGALQAGRAALGSGNRAKNPGSIMSTGYVRDRAGNKQPGWKVRAGDTVAITNHPNDAPRLIHATAWDDTAKTQTMSVDAPPSALDAQQDRVMTALKARGLL
jgi:hypothetical protein